MCACICFFQSWGWYSAFLGCVRSFAQTAVQTEHSQHLSDRLRPQRQPDTGRGGGMASFQKGQGFMGDLIIIFLLLKQSLNHIIWTPGQCYFILLYSLFSFITREALASFLTSPFSFVFLIHLFLFFSLSIKRQIQSGAWPTLAYGIHTGADSFCTLIKSRLSVLWLKSFADVCWRWSTLLLWMALLNCFCSSSSL